VNIGVQNKQDGVELFWIRYLHTSVVHDSEYSVSPNNCRARQVWGVESLVSLTFAADIQLQGVIAALPSDSRSRETLEISRPRLKNAVLALTTINDHWSAISSDLAALHKEMDTHLGPKDEFDLAITIDVGRTSWDAVQLAAKSFVTNVPMQRKYLTGDNYYDESPVHENAWYRLENKYIPHWKIGGLSGDMRGQRIALTNDVQKWSRMKFLRIGGMKANRDE
jgi:hypothetical protein